MAGVGKRVVRKEAYGSVVLVSWMGREGKAGCSGTGDVLEDQLGIFSVN